MNFPGFWAKGTNRPGVKIRKVMPKRKHRMMPTKTGGMDMHSWSRTRTILSKTPPSRRATRIPRGKDTNTVRTKAMMTRAPVAGSFSMTMALTEVW